MGALLADEWHPEDGLTCTNCARRFTPKGVAIGARVAGFDPEPDADVNRLTRGDYFERGER